MSLRIGLQFPAGRYHATPWGRHVNEGEIEWPPSPWRMCRALLATGLGKLHFAEVPEAMTALITALAGEPPVYHLPPASAAHTRHYMPLYKDGTTKVIDAFACVGRDAVLVMEWNVELDDQAVELLDQLLSCMSYLGRSESWIEAQRIHELPAGLTACMPGTEPPGPGRERIDLLAPMPAREYAEWRERTMQSERARRLDAKREQAMSKGTKPPSKLGAKDSKALDAELPGSLIDALCADTAMLQNAGWTQPPGSRWLTYWRHDRALSGGAPGPRRRARGTQYHTALLALSPDTRRAKILPPMRDALWRCEMVHKALVRKSAEGRDMPSPSLSGCDPHGERLRGHGHAMLIPLGLARPDRIDHIAVHAPMGFDDAALWALRNVRRTWAKDLPEIFVSLTGLGSACDDDMARHLPPFDKARAWVSHTPFVPPRYLKAAGKNSLVSQVRAELESRGLPAADAEVDIEVVHPPGRDSPWRGYRRVRQSGQRKPPIDVAFGLRLTFAEPMSGPICLGYASHFGLGVFAPDFANERGPA